MVNNLGELVFQTKVKVKMMGSIYKDEQLLLQNIIKIHNNNQPIELDPMFSKGHFYLKIPLPRYKFDLTPQSFDVQKCDAKQLPFETNSIQSMILDPPFCFGIHGQTENNISAKRFTIIPNFQELETLYKGILKESYRILKFGGLLIFKCQDYTDSKTTMTHCLVYNWASEVGFYAKDIVILQNESRIYNSNLQQKHFRKTHSYFWVFIKR